MVFHRTKFKLIKHETNFIFNIRNVFVTIRTLNLKIQKRRRTTFFFFKRIKLYYNGHKIKNTNVHFIYIYNIYIYDSRWELI